MISFAEFLQVIPQSENVELHIIEGKEHIDVDHFDINETELNYPWYQYSVDTFYTYFDKDNDDTVIHALISFRGEDNNVKKE